jgi:hypothetical protein
MRTTRSWRDVARIVATLTAAIMIFEAGLCSSSSSTQDPEDAVRIQVTLSNEDIFPIHILVSGESFRMGPPPGGNRLDPDASRTVEVGPFRVGDARAFSAGRDGDIFDTESCRVTNTSFTSKTARVEWGLDDELHCINW